MKPMQSSHNLYAVRLPEFDNDQFRSYLEQDGRSVSQVLREMISSEIKRNPNPTYKGTLNHD